MINPAPQLALREWRRHMARPVRLVSLLGVSIILTIATPFGTGEVLSLPGSALYWLCIVFVTYSIGYFANTFTAAQLSAARVPAILVAGATTGIAAFVFVYGLNGLTFGFWPTGHTALRLAGNVLSISLILSAIFQLATSEPEGEAPKTPDLLDRLPLEARGALVSLSVEDHYVHVRTATGEAMILMRLTDAIRESHPTQGLRVHRSHWVALDQITSSTRRGDGAVLGMSNGPDIPVSRANVAALKAAKRLPR